MKDENDNRTEDPVGWTSLEQSRRLESCGLDAKTADMYYEEKFDEYGAPLYEWRLVAEKSRAIEQNLFSHRNGYTVPCWSTGKILSIIRGNHWKFENALFLKDGKNVVLCFWCQAIETPEFSGVTEIEAAVDCVVWLLENEYIEKQK